METPEEARLASLQMDLHEFVRKWERVELKERSAAQEHFLDLCNLLEHPTPATADPDGDHFCFERGAKKHGGGAGWADVWKRGCFAWEYKGRHKHRTLDEAYSQLNQYRESLESPPLLVVCDVDRYEIHTNFTGTVKKVYSFKNAELVNPEHYSTLRRTFFEPEKLKPTFTTARVTEEAAQEFCRVADRLRARKVDAQESAHFLMKVVFCLFAEDVGLLPEGLFKRMIAKTAENPAHFSRAAADIFQAMQRGGSVFLEEILHFNGGLFADARVVDLEEEELAILKKVADLDWSSVEPAIFGTLFERSLNPGKRTQLGAHYTSYKDIVSIVEPVLMTPLRKEWIAVRAKLEALQEKIRTTTSKARRVIGLFETDVHRFIDRLHKVRILDPACGSGNFLYISLKLLKDLEKEVIAFARSAVAVNFFPLVHPNQLYGLEINPYAKELASVVVWIGHLQWLRENGAMIKKNPVLEPLNNIVLCDALLDLSKPGNPKEREWPDADVIVGNPPFLGGKFLRRDLGDEYVDALFKVYDGRVPREADLVCYWFEKARTKIGEMRAKRGGLLGTQGIRGGANRKVLERIKKTGDIFFAVSDREWALDGAMVNISMVGFDDGTEKERVLDGQRVGEIHADLSAGTNLLNAMPLKTNLNLSFMGDTKGGSFDIPAKVAWEMLECANPNRRPNADVVRPWVNTDNLIKKPTAMFIVDFGVDLPLEKAALYEKPFEFIKRAVAPERERSRSTRAEWWLHERPRPDMRTALGGLKRFIATPTVAKYRIFVWLSPDILPDHQLIAIARDDDYAFGVLQSRIHRVWSLRKGTRLQTRPRYTPTTTFETFPFPWPLGKEPRKGQPGYEKVQAIAAAAQDLAAKRDPQVVLPHRPPTPGVRRTLTQLYNEWPTWLADAHAKLDKAVFAAYGWPAEAPDEEILRGLMLLNAECCEQPSSRKR